ncbi:hypothetical protein [Mucilaginibacter achroorhodeus]|uniref:hypothetical protein n=1 Tax=Mucilaginibacter achroorhodeus TaxID=2599294 RepID=UPI001643FD21|nr:hypothetical protein [Mucilaginibacter achroorhodeus]
MTVFQRSDYYSQTELTKLLKLSVKKVKLFLKDNNIPVIERPVELGDSNKKENFTVTALYVLKSDLVNFIA